MSRSIPGLPVHHQLPEFMQIHVHRVGDAIQPSHPLSSPSPPAFNLSQHWVFSSESALHIRWPKYWSFSFSISPSNEHPGPISFRMDWLDLLAVQGTLKSLLQHHSSKTSILWYSAFFTMQLSHPYMTTGKTIALTRQTFVGKVMSLLSNKLSRVIITFLPRSKRLLISWLQSPSAVILEPRKVKSATGSPSICHEVMGLDAMIFVFWMLSFKEKGRGWLIRSLVVTCTHYYKITTSTQELYSIFCNSLWGKRIWKYIYVCITKSVYVHLKLTQCCKSTMHAC